MKMLNSDKKVNPSIERKLMVRINGASEVLLSMLILSSLNRSAFHVRT